VASIAGNPAVIASVIGAPSVLASIPNVASIKVASWFPGADVVASVIGHAAVIASIAGWANVTASIGGFPSVLASIPNVASVVASVVGNAAVTATIAGWANVTATIGGAPSVVASIAGLPSVAIASLLPYVRPNTIYSAISAIARVQASTDNAAALAAKGAGVFNYITQLSVINAAASYGGAVNLCDGTGTLFTGFANIGGGFAVHFPTPLKPAANATVYVSVPVYSLDLFVTVSGFQGA
jgi:hypothetical protein